MFQVDARVLTYVYSNTHSTNLTWIRTFIQTAPIYRQSPQRC